MDLTKIITEHDAHSKQLYKDIMWDINYYTTELEKAERRLEKSKLALESYKEKYGIDGTQL
tara:strand:- start:7 stop:189 length:183 start_codon:yes stop_codon:yes gene_type:complete